MCHVGGNFAPVPHEGISAYSGMCNGASHSSHRQSAEHDAHDGVQKGNSSLLGQYRACCCAHGESHLLVKGIRVDAELLLGQRHVRGSAAIPARHHPALLLFQIHTAVLQTTSATSPETDRRDPSAMQCTHMHLLPMAKLHTPSMLPMIKFEKGDL